MRVWDWDSVGPDEGDPERVPLIDPLWEGDSVTDADCVSLGVIVALHDWLGENEGVSEMLGL